MSTMMDWALFYRSQGLSIIPVQGKIPLIKWAEFQERCASEEEIKAWWEKWPEADIGMVCGAKWNRLVVDVDGAEGIRQISIFSLASTARVQTKRGYQLHYTYPREFQGKTTLAGLLPGVDTRGEGGYVKLPPSLFSDSSGRYSWDESSCEIQDCPASVLELLEAANKPRTLERETEGSWLKEKLDAIAPGNRNATFTSLAGSLRSRGYNSGDIYSLLEDKAEQHDFPLHELRTICESVSQYAPRVQVISDAQSIEEFLQEQQKVEWLVPGVIAKQSINFIAGQPSTYKSWVCMDLAIEAARGGGNWMGKFPVKQAKVLFVDQERFKGESQRRISSLLAAQNVPAKLLKGQLYIASGTSTRLNLQQSFDAFKRKLAEIKPDLVVVDSFSTFHTVGEKDRMEIQKVLELIKDLRNEFGCAFFFIDHETKQSLHSEPGQVKQPSMADMQGNIAKAAVAEMVMNIKRKDETSCMVYVTKNNLAPSIDPFEVRVIDVDEAKTKIRVEGR